MKQFERASMMRLMSDLIKADAVLDAREFDLLDDIKQKYSIKKEDEVFFGFSVGCVFCADGFAEKCEDGFCWRSLWYFNV